MSDNMSNEKESLDIVTWAQRVAEISSNYGGISKSGPHPHHPQVSHTASGHVTVTIQGSTYRVSKKHIIDLLWDIVVDGQKNQRMNISLQNKDKIRGLLQGVFAAPRSLNEVWRSTVADIYQAFGHHQGLKSQDVNFQRLWEICAQNHVQVRPFVNRISRPKFVDQIIQICKTLANLFRTAAMLNFLVRMRYYREFR